ncbi:MAG: hypothetical protein K0Q74_948 [Gammaproteobacteria bacterium]|nr:hypothetical protein [Gammaproteobacteria bacterium]
MPNSAGFFAAAAFGAAAVCYRARTAPVDMSPRETIRLSFAAGFILYAAGGFVIQNDLVRGVGFGMISMSCVIYTSLIRPMFLENNIDHNQAPPQIGRPAP